MKEQENLKSTVLKLYSAGSKVSDIVLQTGIPRSTVYYWIKNEIPKETSPLNLRDYHFHVRITPTTILFVNFSLRRLNKKKYIVRIIDLKKICCVP